MRVHSPPHRKPYIVHRIVAVKFYHTSHWINLANSACSRFLEMGVSVEADWLNLINLLGVRRERGGIPCEGGGSDQLFHVDQQGATD